MNQAKREMNKPEREILTSLKESDCFKQWIKNPRDVTLKPYPKKQIVFAHCEEDRKHTLYVFMDFGDKWECSVDVSSGTFLDVIDRILVRA